ncbi:MAG: hypothetical protein HUJ70_12155 [Pseudobutyrivibrio sp.]|nr:hypothetical protein [Pseudobutyrivibrio sp.]
MITKDEIVAISQRKQLDFSKTLAAVVCQTLIEIISTEDCAKPLWLCNGNEFCEDYIRLHESRNLYYQYCGELEDDRFLMLFNKDLLKALKNRGSNHFSSTEGEIEDFGIRLSVTIEDMYVPINIYTKRHVSDRVSFDLSTLKSLRNEEKVISYAAYPKEQIVCAHLSEIIDKLELINEVDRYYEVYEILSSYPINGRKVKETLNESFKDMDRSALLKRVNIIRDYGSYTYMKKKWKVVLRQKKTSEPQWQDVINCLYSFLNPIVDSMIKNTVFLGDWMPQLKRYLD